MKRNTTGKRFEYRPSTNIDHDAAEHMHRLGAAYGELALYWLSSGKAPTYLARCAYETAAMIHTLASTIEQLSKIPPEERDTSPTWE